MGPECVWIVNLDQIPNTKYILFLKKHRIPNIENFEYFGHTLSACMLRDKLPACIFSAKIYFWSYFLGKKKLSFGTFGQFLFISVFHFSPTQDDPRMALGWLQDDSRISSGWPQDDFIKTSGYPQGDLTITSSWTQTDLRITSGWLQDNFRVTWDDLRLSQNDLRMTCPNFLFVQTKCSGSMSSQM